MIEKAKVYVDSWDNDVVDYFDKDKLKLRRFFGIVSQFIVSDLLDLPEPVNRGADGGTDIYWNNKTWDIKTEIRQSYFKPRLFVHNVHGGQINNEVDGYIFVNYNQSDGGYEVCGFIEKDKFIKYAEFYSGGTLRKRTDGSIMSVRPGGVYEIKQKFLEKFKIKLDKIEEPTRSDLIKGQKDMLFANKNFY